MPETGKIGAALALSQAKFTPIKKNRIAKVKMKSGGEYSYKYADFADILAMAVPILAKNEIAFVQLTKLREGKLRLASSLLHSSGEVIESDGIAIPENILPQDFGSILTYWRRYDGCSLLGIQPDSDDDAKAAMSHAKSFANRVEDDETFDQRTNMETRIAQFQVDAFWKAADKSGHSKDAVAAFLEKLGGYIQVEEITKGNFNDAIKWASKPSSVPVDLVSAMQPTIAAARARKPVESPANAKSETERLLARIFASAAEKKIPDFDVKQWAYETFSVKSMTELSGPQLQAVIEWVKEA